MGAAFIEEAVASALVEIGIDPRIDSTEADRVADRCRVAVTEASAAIHTLTALTIS